MGRDGKQPDNLVQITRLLVVMNSKPEVVRVLLDVRVDACCIDLSASRSRLFLAAWGGYMDVVRMLLKAGVDSELSFRWF